MPLFDQTLKETFRNVLIGFERFSFTEEQIRQYADDFEWALEDYYSCKACKVGLDPEAKCRSHTGRVKKGTPGYYSLYWIGCELYKRPSFAMTICGDPELALKRKRKIAESMLSGREEGGKTFSYAEK